MILAGALVSGAVADRLFRDTPDQIVQATRTEWLLALSTVTMNTAISVAGWALWKLGWLKLNSVGSLVDILRDTLVLVFTMDLSLYVLHRIAHLPIFYRIAHYKHHEYRTVRVITLFVMHPLEALGFGMLWVMTLTLFPFTVEAVLIFLTINMYFGIAAHCGVALYPRPLKHLIGRLGFSDPDFHACHHREENYNLGFYTTIWDRLFKTMRS